MPRPVGRRGADPRFPPQHSGRFHARTFPRRALCPLPGGGGSIATAAIPDTGGDPATTSPGQSAHDDAAAAVGDAGVEAPGGDAAEPVTSTVEELTDRLSIDPAPPAGPDADPEPAPDEWGGDAGH